MRYRYAGVIALDPNTDQTTIVRSATGTVHVNENWSNAATVYDPTGFAMTTLSTTAEGLFPDFYVDDHQVVGFKTSSGHRFYLVSSTPPPGTPGPAVSDVIARDGQFIFVYPDGTEIPGPTIPEGEPGQDGTVGYPVSVVTQTEYNNMVTNGTTVTGTFYAILEG